MAVLILGEVTDGALNLDATAKAVGAVRALGEVTVLVAGAQARAAAAEAAKIAGVAKVLVAESPLYGHRLAEPTAPRCGCSRRRRRMPRTCCRASRRFWT